MKKAILFFAAALMSTTTWAQSPAPRSTGGKTELSVTGAKRCAAFTNAALRPSFHTTRVSPIHYSALKTDDIFLFVTVDSHSSTDPISWFGGSYVYYGDRHYSMAVFISGVGPSLLFVIPKTETAFTLEIRGYKPVNFTVSEEVFVECDKYYSKEYGFRVAFSNASVEIQKAEADKLASFSATSEDPPWIAQQVQVLPTDFKQTPDVDAELTGWLEAFERPKSNDPNVTLTAEVINGVPKGLIWGTTAGGLRFAQANIHFLYKKAASNTTIRNNIEMRAIAVPSKNEIFLISASSDGDEKTNKQGFIDSFELTLP